MHIQSFHEPESGTWCHLIADPVSKAAAIIDPVLVYDPVSGLTDASFIQQVIEVAASNDYRIDWVLETHAHADHLTAADYLRYSIGAKIACGRGICAVQKNFARVFNMDLPLDGSQFDRLLVGGDIIEIGQLQVHVMETPGHTGDSVTYLVEDAAFIGDTLFAPGYGTARCDFPGGDAGQLFDSIVKIYQLPKETRLFLCHDYPKEGREPRCEVSVQESLKENVHVNAETAKEDFIVMREQRDAQLGLPRLILPSLQVNILAGAAPGPDSNGVSYLRTPLNRSIEDLIKEH
jgi:glyoxylase-like metal-dependent hydrolase (beta-lactamase superfamily II)